MKHLLSVVVLVAVLASLALAGQRLTGKKQALRGDDDAAYTQRTSVPTAVQSLHKQNALTWTVVDSANNAFGIASWEINPLAYDAASHTLAFIHRGRTGYGSSGQLWYNISRDGGLTWKRVPGGLNAGVMGNNSRYPSGAISNGLQSADTADISFVYANPELTGGAFGAIRYGIDFPIGSGTVTSVEQEPPPTFSSQTWIWTSPNSDDVYWVAPQDFGYTFFHTVDYVTIDTVTPPTWYESHMQTYVLDSVKMKGAAGSYDYINGFERNGAQYVGMLAIFNGDTLAVADTAFQYNYNLGYAKSTDGGVTWAEWVRPQAGPSKNWNGLPGFGPTWYIAAGFTSARPNAHMMVDKDNLVHFVAVVVDTATSTYAVAEIYETAPNTWASKIIKSGLNRNVLQNYYNPADPYAGGEADLDQDSWDLSFAMDTTANVMAVVYLDAPAGDTLPDIYLSSRSLGSDWSTPANLTQTPAEADLMVHTALVLKTEAAANTYTIYLQRAWEHDLPFTSYPPANSGHTDFWVSSTTFVPPVTAVGTQPTVARSYALDQNYPNPFNPNTTIKYSVANGGFVSLKVFNVLGQEVASLVNEVKAAGSYTVSFNASKFASGVYFYALKAGSFNQVKKMVLMK